MINAESQRIMIGEGKLYIFQNAPAGVCQQCGEKYLTGEVAEKIERKVQTKDKWTKTVAVPVQVLP